MKRICVMAQSIRAAFRHEGQLLFALHQAHVHRHQSQASSVAGAEFFVQVLTVLADGGGAHMQHRCRLFDIESFGQHLEHLALTFGQFLGLHLRQATGFRSDVNWHAAMARQGIGNAAEVDGHEYPLAGSPLVARHLLNQTINQADMKMHLLMEVGAKLAD